MNNYRFNTNTIGPYIKSFSLVIFTTLAGEILKTRLEPTNIVMFYLLVVVFSSIRWGKGPAVFTAIASVAAFDFFLVPPYLTFTVDDIQYLFTFAAFLIVGIIMSTFASKIKRQIIQEQTEKLYSALLNSISHDIKTPLVTITGSLSTLLDTRSKLTVSEKTEFLKTANEESKKLNKIVNDILDMTRMKADALRISKQPCGMRDLIGVCLEQLKERIQQRKITISIPKDLPEVCLDFPFMVKALYNIIDNALKYSPDASPLEIKTFQELNRIAIEIIDHGCGITEKEAKLIFEKFYRGARTKHISGTGLGLCISKAIIDAHEGQISIKSELNKGAVFKIILPLETGSK
ncbi:MAG: DUF4118 domain-containing protein [Candidatus Omnitrophota bacterium]